MKQKDPNVKVPDPSFYPGKDYNANGQGEAPSESDLLKTIRVLGASGPFLNPDGRIALRAFILPTSTYIGYLIEESADSFYILFLSSFEKDATRMVSLVSPTASTITRLLKTSGCMVAMPTPPQVLYYLSLTEARFSEAPSYFTEQRKTFISNLISMLKTELKVVRVKSNTTEESPTFVSAEKTGKVRGDDGKIVVPDLLMSKLVH